MLRLLAAVIADANTDVLKVCLRGTNIIKDVAVLPNGIEICDTAAEHKLAWVRYPFGKFSCRWIKAKHPFTHYICLVSTGHTDKKETFE